MSSHLFNKYNALLKSAKLFIGAMLVPLVQFYFRHIPSRFGKEFLWNKVRWRERNIVAKTNFGAKMNLRTNELVQCYIYYFGVWEPNLTRFISNRLRGQTGRSFVDVGANVGYFSLLASRHLSKGKVISIEALPTIYKRLTRNIAINRCDNVRVVNCAVTEKAGSVPIYYSSHDNEGASTTIGGVFKSEPTYVEGLSLGDLLNSGDLKQIRLIKIDVEGAEYGVVKGMEHLLDNMAEDLEVAIEISPKLIGEDKVREIFSIFDQKGFYAYTLPNCYEPSYYMEASRISDITSERKLERVVQEGPLSGSQMDIVFSRQETDSLTF